MSDTRTFIVEHLEVHEGGVGIAIGGAAALGGGIKLLTEGVELASVDYQARIANFLEEYIGSPDKPVPFGGRQNVIAGLDSWVESGRDPFLLLVGPAGRGKSAVAAHWALRRMQQDDVVFFPISARFRTNLASVVFPALATRLAHFLAPPSPVNWIAATEAARGMVSEYLTRSHSKRLIVILDGLDEAADWEVGADLFPMLPPSTLRILVTARSQPGELAGRVWLSTLGWERHGCTAELGPLSLSGTAEVLSDVDEAIVRKVFHLSEGDPLVTRLYANDIANKKASSGTVALNDLDLGTVVPGLDGYLDRWWREQRRLWLLNPNSVRREARFSEILSLLACALGPLTREDLVGLHGHLTRQSMNIVEADDVFEGISRLVSGDASLSLSHPRFSEFFKSRLTPSECERYERAFVEWGNEVLDQLVAGTATKVPAYLVECLGTHMSRPGASSDDSLSLLTSAPWRRACFELEGAHNGYLADQARFWNRMESRLDQNQPQKEIGRAISALVRLVLIETSIRHRVDNMPSELIAALVRDRLWTLNRALRTILTIDDLRHRARALIALAETTESTERAGLVDEALVLARQEMDRSCKSQEGGETECDNARQFYVELGLAALPLIESVQRVDFLASLANVLLQTHSTSFFGSHARLASLVGGPLAQSILEHGVRIFQSEQFPRAEEAACFAPWVRNGAAILKQAVESLSRIPDSHAGFKVRYAEGLLGHMPPELVTVLVDDFRRITDPSDRCAALVKAYKYVSETERERVAEEAMDAAVRAGDPVSLAEASGLAEPGSRVFFTELALAVSTRIGDVAEQAELQVACSVYVAPPERDCLLTITLEKALTCENKADRMRALLTLRRAASGPMRLHLDELCVRELFDSEIDGPFYEWVRELASCLPRDTVTAIVEKGMELGRHYADGGNGSLNNMVAWTDLVLTDTHLEEDVFEEACRLAENIPLSYARARALAALLAGARDEAMATWLVARCLDAIDATCCDSREGSGPGTLMGFNIFSGPHFAAEARVKLASSLEQTTIGCLATVAAEQWAMCMTELSLEHLIANVQSENLRLFALQKAFAAPDPPGSGVSVSFFRETARTVAVMDPRAFDGLVTRLQASNENRTEVCHALASVGDLLPEQLRLAVVRECLRDARRSGRDRALNTVRLLLPSIVSIGGNLLVEDLLGYLREVLSEWP